MITAQIANEKALFNWGQKNLTSVQTVEKEILNQATDGKFEHVLNFNKDEAVFANNLATYMKAHDFNVEVDVDKKGVLLTISW